MGLGGGEIRQPAFPLRRLQIEHSIEIGLDEPPFIVIRRRRVRTSARRVEASK
jgi:hypothetical protein